MKATYSIDETEKIAQELLQNLEYSAEQATILGLTGELGAGKTTLVQSLASVLGVVEDIVSPTFVIAKFYVASHDQFKRLVHIDAYRIEDPSELEQIGWEDIIKDKDTLVIIEWPMKIDTYLPERTKHFVIKHGGDTRTIEKYEKN